MANELTPERVIGAREWEEHFAVYAEPPFSDEELSTLPLPVIEGEGVSFPLRPAFEMSDSGQVLLGFRRVFFGQGKEEICSYLDTIAQHLGNCTVRTQFEVL